MDFEAFLPMGHSALGVAEAYAFLDLALTLLAQALCIAALIRLRSLKPSKFHKPVSTKAMRGKINSFNRPTKPLRAILKAREFEKMSRIVISDTSHALLEGDQFASEAKALLPIILEIRKHGENLIETQSRTQMLLPGTKVRMKLLVKDLKSLEALLKETPKRTLSLEDVLLGNFEGAQKKLEETVQEI